MKRSLYTAICLWSAKLNQTVNLKRQKPEAINEQLLLVENLLQSDFNE